MEKITVFHKYTDDELAAVREKFTTDQIKLEELKEKKQALMKDLGNEIKDSQSDLKELRLKIKNKGEEREVSVEGKPNYVKNMMEFYAVHGEMAGEMVSSRRLLPHERQMSILSQDQSTQTKAS